MRALYAAWALSAAIAVGFVVGTTTVLPFLPVPRGRRERYTIVGASWWARFVVQLVLWTRVRVIGGAHLTPGSGALLICNHRSWLDPLLLLGWTRSNGLSKRSILYLPVIGLYAHLAGAVFFDREDRAARAWARGEVRRLVRAGHRIQVFPEGTRSRDGRLRSKVFLRLVRDAWNDGIPVVPCAVERTEQVLPPGRFAAWPGEVTLAIGAAMEPSEFDSEEAFAIEAWRRVKELVAAAH